MGLVLIDWAVFLILLIDNFFSFFFLFSKLCLLKHPEHIIIQDS